MSATIRAFIRRHVALLPTAAAVGLAMFIDRILNMHALGMFIVICVALGVADAWDEETMRKPVNGDSQHGIG